MLLDDLFGDIDDKIDKRVDQNSKLKSNKTEKIIKIPFCLKHNIDISNRKD